MKTHFFIALLAPQIGLTFELIPLPGGTRALVEVTHSNFDGVADPGQTEVDHDSNEGEELRRQISAALSPLENIPFSRIEQRLGPTQPLTDDYRLPTFAHCALAISGHQDMGDYQFHFYPVEDWGGVLVIKYEKKTTISGSALYVRENNQNRIEAAISALGTPLVEAFDRTGPK